MKNSNLIIFSSWFTFLTSDKNQASKYLAVVSDLIYQGQMIDRHLYCEEVESQLYQKTFYVNR
jgi:hypothetical protein